MMAVRCSVCLKRDTIPFLFFFFKCWHFLRYYWNVCDMFGSGIPQRYGTKASFLNTSLYISVYDIQHLTAPPPLQCHRFNNCSRMGSCPWKTFKERSNVAQTRSSPADPHAARGCMTNKMIDEILVYALICFFVCIVWPTFKLLPL